MTNPLRRTAPAAAVALLCAGLLAGCGGNADDGATAADHSTHDGSGTTPADPATGTAGTSPATGATETGPSRAGLVYYVTKTSMGDRLVAEQTDETGSDAATAALAALLKAAPIDPDYRSVVPAGSLQPKVRVEKATHQAPTLVLTLTDPKWATLPSGMSAADAKLAVQQLAYTLNAAAGTSKQPAKVTFVNRTSRSTFLGQPAMVTAGKPLQTLALMNVLSPVDGSTLKAGKTAFSGVGSSFEATVAWTVQDSSGKAVLRGSAMASGWQNHLYPWKSVVDLSKLPAGSYTFVASTDDPSEGEGPGPVTDTKTFTIG